MSENNNPMQVSMESSAMTLELLLQQKKTLEFMLFQLARTKIEHLSREAANLQARLDLEQLNHSQTQQALDALREAHAEDVRIHEAIEFRRGQRTQKHWSPFCPKCHMPALETGDKIFMACTDSECSWTAPLRRGLATILSEIR